MARLNYSSASSDPEVDERFESELSSARGDPGDPVATVIAGRRVAAGDMVERRDPSRTSQVVSRACQVDRATITAAVDAARAAAAEWRALPAAGRVESLRVAKERFAEDTVAIGALIAAETGKTRLEAMAEAEEAVDLIGVYSEQLVERAGFEAQQGSLSPAESNYDVLRPYGVFAVLSPFNFPVALTVNMTAAALDRIDAGVLYVNRPTGATTGAWPGVQSFCGWKASGSTGKGGLGPWYLPGFMREQNRTYYTARTTPD